MTAKEIIQFLDLSPLPFEGGYFRQTHRSAETVQTHNGQRLLYTSIYYLITTDTFSSLHKLPHDEIFHFYLGDPVMMLQLHPTGDGSIIHLGTDLGQGQQPQIKVTAETWQGTKLLPGGEYALLGTTMSPGFDEKDFVAPDKEELLAQYPAFAEEIEGLLR